MTNMMATSSLRWGLAATLGLVTFYVSVLATASGWDHLGEQARKDWWLLVPIVLGFGTQVAVTVELRRRHRAHHLAASTSAGTSASAVGMVACCAHHLAELVPLVGATGLAAFLLDWRIPFMLTGITINAVAVSFAARRLRRVLVAEAPACAA